MSTVHISLNELENVSYKALESLKYDEGFCEAISKDITVLQSMGFPALSQFVNFLSFSKNIDHHNAHPIITISDTEESHTYFCDCLNISCIHFIQPLIEYIINLVTQHLCIAVLFSNSYDYVFLLPYLQKFSPVPLSMEWYNKKQNKYNIGFIFPNNEYPELFSRIPQDQEPRSRPTLVSHTSIEDAMHAQKTHVAMCPHIERINCVQYFQTSVAQGLFVPEEEWNLIQGFEKAVLVPSSEASRSGAGEAAHAVDVEDMLFKKI